MGARTSSDSSVSLFLKCGKAGFFGPFPRRGRADVTTRARSRGNLWFDERRVSTDAEAPRGLRGGASSRCRRNGRSVPREEARRRGHVQVARRQTHLAGARLIASLPGDV